MAFVNSLKMKISVIIGVVHMSVGLIAKALNAIHFKSAIDFFLEFLPELIFLLVLFGYMDALIIVKWSIDWGLYNPNAPSIITTMINFPLRLGKTVQFINITDRLLRRPTYVGNSFGHFSKHHTILAVDHCYYMCSLDPTAKAAYDCL